MAAYVTVFKWILCLMFVIYVTASKSDFTVDDERGLKDSMKQNDSTRGIRPSRVTLVQLSFTLIAINAVDIKNEQFGVTGYWSMQWDDHRLDWEDKAQFSSIPAIQFKSSEIWTPAIVVDNSIDNMSAIGDASIPIRVRKDGTVTWNPAGILLTSCEMDVTYFPFDEQTCSIQVTSFGYTIQELNMSVRDTGVSTKYYQQNGEWILGHVSNKRAEFEEDGYTYAKLNYFMSLKRRPVYYGMNMLLPVVVNSMLIPLVFLLPHDAGEKIGYCLTVLLAYVVLLTIVTDGLPTTAKTQSLLGVYIALVMTMSGISVVLGIHSLSIFHRSPQLRIPSWQARLTHSMRSLMRLRCCSRNTASTRSVSPVQQIDQNDIYSHSSQGQMKKQRADQLKRANSYAQREVVQVTPRRGKKQEMIGMSSEPEGEEDMTWQLVARTYDAFFLRLYFIIIVCACVGFLFGSASNRF